MVTVGDPVARNKDDDLMPYHSACSECDANEPLGYSQTTSSKRYSAKFNQDDLSDDRDDHDVPKYWIAKNVLKYVAMIVELAHVDLVEFCHHDKHVEDHCVVYGRQLLVSAVAILIEQWT